MDAIVEKLTIVALHNCLAGGFFGLKTGTSHDMSESSFGIFLYFYCGSESLFQQMVLMIICNLIHLICIRKTKGCLNVT